MPERTLRKPPVGSSSLPVGSVRIPSEFAERLAPALARSDQCLRTHGRAPSIGRAGRRRRSMRRDRGPL